jgi:hypothetical protein
MIYKIISNFIIDVLIDYDKFCEGMESYLTLLKDAFVGSTHIYIYKAAILHGFQERNKIESNNNIMKL